MSPPLPRLAQSPADPAFVQDPYTFYDRARAMGPIVWWEEFGLPCATTHAAVDAILRDRRMGREIPPDRRPPVPDHLAGFHAVEAHSMLELEPPRHTRLRGLVLRAFTTRRIRALAPEIAALATDLAEALPEDETDLLPAFAQRLPVIVIARLLGVPEDMADQLLAWSNAMVAMYQTRRSPAIEAAADAAARDFAAFLRAHLEDRRRRPGDDLITHLLAAEAEGSRLTPDELISTCILLLNAGHEATVHSIGNGVKALLDWAPDRAALAAALAPDAVAATVEEVLRFDPPLHLFTRQVYAEVEIAGHRFAPGDEIACLLAAAGRDPALVAEPHLFRPDRPPAPHLAFGVGLHFCVGAPLARLELQLALPALFACRPGLRLARPPAYADLYHFHGLASLPVIPGPPAR
jgi:unspecific monooxygenase